MTPKQQDWIRQTGNLNRMQPWSAESSQHLNNWISRETFTGKALSSSHDAEMETLHWKEQERLLQFFIVCHPNLEWHFNPYTLKNTGFKRIVLQWLHRRTILGSLKNTFHGTVLKRTSFVRVWRTFSPSGALW